MILINKLTAQYPPSLFVGQLTRNCYCIKKGTVCLSFHNIKYISIILLPIIFIPVFYPYTKTDLKVNCESVYKDILWCVSHSRETQKSHLIINNDPIHLKTLMMWSLHIAQKNTNNKNNKNPLKHFFALCNGIDAEYHEVV